VVDKVVDVTFIGCDGAVADCRFCMGIGELPE
jgi:hypothetical protein